MRHVCDSRVAHQLSHFHRGHIERLGQCFAHRYFAVKFFTVIIGSVFLAIEIKRGRLIHYGRGWSNDRQHAVHRALECSGIHKRLERGTRLPAR